MKNSFDSASPNWAESMILQPCSARKPETRCTMPRWSRQDRVRMNSGCVMVSVQMGGKNGSGGQYCRMAQHGFENPLPGASGQAGIRRMGQPSKPPGHKKARPFNLMYSEAITSLE